MSDTHYFRPARQPQRSSFTLWRRLGAPRLSRIPLHMRDQLKLLWRGFAV